MEEKTKQNEIIDELDEFFKKKYAPKDSEELRQEEILKELRDIRIYINKIDKIQSSFSFYNESKIKFDLPVDGVDILDNKGKLSYHLNSEGKLINCKSVLYKLKKWLKRFFAIE